MMGNPSSTRKHKGKYFLDIIDDTIYSTNNFTLYNFYRSIFYGKPFPGEITGFKPGPEPDWDVITFNGKITHKKIDGKYVRVE